MNKVDAWGRIIRNIGTLQYQMSLLNSSGYSASAYCESAIMDSLNIANNWRLYNLNDSNNNSPAVDLLSADGTIGIQATYSVGKVKYDNTVDALVKELKVPGNSLSSIKQLHVVGLKCVKNSPITKWSAIPGTGIVARAYALDKSSLRHSGLGEAEVDDLDRLFQGLVTMSGPPLKSDADELKTIIHYLIRPAIADSHTTEMNWNDMSTAMRDIRFLLSQGANSSGVMITRPLNTFQPDPKAKLESIYQASNRISHILSSASANGTLTVSSGKLVDGYRTRIREVVEALCQDAGISKPTWP